MNNCKYHYFISFTHNGTKTNNEGALGFACTTLHTDTRIEDQISDNLEGLHKDISDMTGVKNPVILWYKQL